MVRRISCELHHWRNDIEGLALFSYILIIVTDSYDVNEAEIRSEPGRNPVIY